MPCRWSILVAERAAKQDEGANRSGHDRHGGARMAVHLTTQTTVVVVGLVGKIFRCISQTAAVAVALFAETLDRTLGNAAAALKKVLCAAGCVVGVTAHAVASTFTGGANLTFNISVTQDCYPPSVDEKNAQRIVSTT